MFNDVQVSKFTIEVKGFHKSVGIGRNSVVRFLNLAIVRSFPKPAILLFH